MGNNSICSCKNSDINTESSIIREDKNRNDLLKKSRSEATFNSVLEKKIKKRKSNFKYNISMIKRNNIKQLCKKITNCIKKGVEKLTQNPKIYSKKKSNIKIFNNNEFI